MKVRKDHLTFKIQTNQLDLLSLSFQQSEEVLSVGEYDTFDLTRSVSLEDLVVANNWSDIRQCEPYPNQIITVSLGV